ncbi:hypothetical protein HK104_005435, partial [Borealophlyctis nickersoniae]
MDVDDKDMTPAEAGSFSSADEDDGEEPSGPSRPDTPTLASPAARPPIPLRRTDSSLAYTENMLEDPSPKLPGDSKRIVQTAKTSARSAPARSSLG